MPTITSARTSSVWRSCARSASSCRRACVSPCLIASTAEPVKCGISTVTTIASERERPRRDQPPLVGPQKSEQSVERVHSCAVNDYRRRMRCDRARPTGLRLSLLHVRDADPTSERGRSRGAVRHVRAPAGRAQHTRVRLLALHTLARRSSLSALPASSGDELPRVRTGRERQLLIIRFRGGAQTAEANRHGAVSADGRSGLAGALAALAFGRAAGRGDEVAAAHEREGEQRADERDRGGDQQDAREGAREADRIGVLQRARAWEGERVSDCALRRRRARSPACRAPLRSASRPGALGARAGSSCCA